MDNQFIIDRLDRLCATRMTPVRLGDKSTHKPKLKPVSGEQAQFLKETYPDGGLQAKERILRDGLLAFGGEYALIRPMDEDMEHFLTRGQLWGKTQKMMPGAPSQCHMNACLLWEQNQDQLFVATGYALSNDGLWRQHSWCVLPGARGAGVIETTQRRELYYGYVMTLEETIDFGTNNTDMGIEVHESTRARYRFGLEPDEAQDALAASQLESERLDRMRA